MMSTSRLGPRDESCPSAAVGAALPIGERPVTADAHRSVKGLTLTIFNNVSDLVGRTPLIRVNNASERSGAEVIAKLESYNPANSVKDRIGVAMIDAAEKSGELKPVVTIIDATSGKSGYALAMVSTSRGYRVNLSMPESMTKERRALLRAFGTELVITDKAEGMKGAVAKAKELDADGA